LLAVGYDVIFRDMQLGYKFCAFSVISVIMMCQHNVLEGTDCRSVIMYIKNPFIRGWRDYLLGYYCVLGVQVIVNARQEGNMAHNLPETRGKATAA
jgi:hypothetical protein